MMIKTSPVALTKLDEPQDDLEKWEPKKTFLKTPLTAIFFDLLAINLFLHY